MVFISTLLKSRRQPDVTSTDIPEEDPERVGVYTAVILAREKFGRHVDRGSDYAATHHGFWLAEPEISDLAPVVLVQLYKSTQTNFPFLKSGQALCIY